MAVGPNFLVVEGEGDTVMVHEEAELWLSLLDEISHTTKRRMHSTFNRHITDTLVDL